jgi:restriction endonuclease S subunit
LFFCRSEFDRYARINSWGSATELFLFEDLCNIKFAVPNLKEQEKIVNTYNAITKRIQLKQKINENLEKTAQTIYKKMFVEYADEPGVIGRIAGILGEKNINIVDIRAPQDPKTGRSLCVITTNVEVPEMLVNKISDAVNASKAFSFTFEG